MFSFNIIGDQRVRMLMERFDRNINNLTPALEEFVDEFCETEKSIFGTEGSFQGRSKWPGLSDSYLDWKEIEYPGQKILHLKGPLKASLISKGSNFVERMGGDFVEVGTSDEKAAYHQFGTSKMPPRPPISVNQQQVKRWVKILAKHLFEI